MSDTIEKDGKTYIEISYLEGATRLSRQRAADRDAFKAFKEYVHQRLDDGGVPKEFPDGEHTRAGCRIGDRLDWVFAKIPPEPTRTGEFCSVCKSGLWTNDATISSSINAAGDQGPKRHQICDFIDRIGGLTDKAEQYRQALERVMPWVGEPSEGPAWATDEAKRRNKEMCDLAFDEASKCFPANHGHLPDCLCEICVLLTTGGQ